MRHSTGPEDGAPASHGSQLCPHSVVSSFRTYERPRGRGCLMGSYIGRVQCRLSGFWGAGGGESGVTWTCDPSLRVQAPPTLVPGARSTYSPGCVQSAPPAGHNWNLCNPDQIPGETSQDTEISWGAILSSGEAPLLSCLS